MGFFSRNRDPLELEAARVAAHPRYRRGHNHSGRLCIGHVIDWLRAEHDDDPDRGRALLRYSKWPQDDTQRAAYTAAAIAKLDSSPNLEALEINFRGDSHWIEYGARYHAHVVAHMEQDELAVAEPIYRSLLTRLPDDYAALANVAELERRAGDRDAALELARRALARARAEQLDPGAIGPALGARNEPETWRIPLACLCARLEGARDERARAYLEWANAEDFDRIIAELSDLSETMNPLWAAHAAFGSANDEQRLWLRVCFFDLGKELRPPLYPGGPDEYEATLARLSDPAVIAKRSRAGEP